MCPDCGSIKRIRKLGCYICAKCRRVLRSENAKANQVGRAMKMPDRLRREMEYAAFYITEGGDWAETNFNEGGEWMWQKLGPVVEALTHYAKQDPRMSRDEIAVSLYARETLKQAGLVDDEKSNV